MLHRIRLAMQSKSFVKLGGPGSAPIEVDETFIGGKARNMHKCKASAHSRSSGMQGGSGKAIVMGMLERGGQVQATGHSESQAHIAETGACANRSIGQLKQLYTDEFAWLSRT